MPDRLKRVRLAVVLALFAFPLLASGVAQAAIAGALPATSTTQPNLLSATPVPGVSSQVQVCFDKVITVGPLGTTGFFLGGYRNGNTLGSTNAQVDPTNTKCVIATFPVSVVVTGGTSNIETLKYTVVSVLPDSVSANTGTPASSANAGDSTALTPPTPAQASKDGTRGVSAQPNLVGILSPTGSNQLSNSLTFVFDRNALVRNATDFFYVNSAGNACQGIAVLGGDGTTTVTVTFGATSAFPGATCAGTATVAQAIRGGVLQDAVSALYDQVGTNYNQTVQLPNCTASCSASGRPNVVSAVLNPGNLDQIIYTFDQNVTVNPLPGFNTGGTGFQAELSNGGVKDSTGTPVSSGKTVTVDFGGDLSSVAEYAVAAWANYGAVVPSDNPTASGFSLPGSAPIGDNAGGLSPGFTTGADVFGATISASGTVTITTDQRVEFVNPNRIQLLSSNGQVIPATGSPSFNSTAPPGPGTVTMTYPASQVVNATMVQFLANHNDDSEGGNQAAFETALSPVAGSSDASEAGEFGQFGNDEQNMPQIVTAVRTASILKAYKAYKVHHRATSHKRQHAKKHHTSKTKKH